MSDEINKEVYLVGELFRELFYKINRVENKKILYKEFDELTIGEINTLLVIGRSNTISMSEIANSLGVSFGTPTVTIDRLIQKGYVERIHDEEDRRQVFIKLSVKGDKVFNDIIELKGKFTLKLFGVLTQEERKGAISTLSKLNNMFEEIIKFE